MNDELEASLKKRTQALLKELSEIAPEDTPNRIRATSARLAHLERRRHHAVIEAQQKELVAAMTELGVLAQLQGRDV